MFLEKIIAHKREILPGLREEQPLATLERRIAASPPPRDFVGALARPGRRIIAEIKPASPSRGVIRGDFNPAHLACAYTEGGAAALSVLTEERFFRGDPARVAQVKAVSPLPVLWKDFIIEEYQVYAARAAGADAVLLIAAVLEDATLRRLAQVARALDLATLVEVHNPEELGRVTRLQGEGAGFSVLGFNNRNLETFQVDLKTSIWLQEQAEKEAVWKDVPRVSESGVHSRADIAFLQAGGLRVFLIGEALMRAEDPRALLEELRKEGAAL